MTAASKSAPPGTIPAWFATLLGIAAPPEGGTVAIRGQRFLMQGGILRARALASAAQAQTADAFGFKWHRRDTFERPEQLARMRDWLVQRYGEVTQEPWFADLGPAPLVLDAGCGGAMSGIELFKPVLGRVRYIGTDISAAVEVAAARFHERDLAAAFLQADLMALPLPPGSVDVILAEGVLHHTDSTEAALKALAPLLKAGGRFLLYVYRKKGPVREFTDDYIRDRLQQMTPEQAWEALKPLTRLGIALGELNAAIDVPEAIDLLGVPAGRIDVQRFFYWNVAKAFYRPDYTFDEMHHINFDWYAPKNAHRQSPEEVRRWCAEAGLAIEREVVEEAGISVIASKSA